MKMCKVKTIKKQCIAWVIVITGIMQIIHWTLLWTNIKSREYLGILLIVLVTTISDIIADFEVRRYNPLVAQILFLICSYLAILMNVSIQAMIVTMLVEMMIILGGIRVIYLRNDKNTLLNRRKNNE